MIITRPEDTLHKLQLFRLLTEIADTPILSAALYFKGGTAASMLGYLDRFSVDLDFDLKPGSETKALRYEFHRLFTHIGLQLDDESKRALLFFLKYDSPKGQRNTLKLDAVSGVWKANRYEPKRLSEIDRTLVCETKETMVSNKLVAPLDRWKKHKKIAGRDIYDIHSFLSHGYRYIPEILTERTGLPAKGFFRTLVSFIEKRVTERIITEDLNTLLIADTFQNVRKTLVRETIMLLREEYERW